MIRFADQQLLYLLALIPLIILIQWLGFRRRKHALDSFGSTSLVAKLSLTSRPAKQKSRAVIMTMALTLLIIAAARPQIGTKVELVKRQGIDIVIAVDTSDSMGAEDAMGKSKGRRIDKAKHEISALLDILETDRVGLVAFAGSAHVQCPLTLDYDAVNIFLDVMDTDLIPDPGTAIGYAIETATAMFDKHDNKNKVLILITDGEDHIADPVEAAKEAKKSGVLIYPIGIGSPDGTPVPDYDSKGNKIGFKKDRDGNLVLSKLDDVTLEKVALHSGGKYYPASLGEIELKKIHGEISGLDKKELATRKYTHYEDRFQLFLAAALFLLMLEAFITTGVTRKTKRSVNNS